MQNTVINYIASFRCILKQSAKEEMLPELYLKAT